MREMLNFVLVGVGGQGTILASEVLVEVGIAAGYQAKQAEVHGMSQRGGSVTSYVRWGKQVHSPLIGLGEADVMLAFEKAEALRNIHQLRPGGLALINWQAIEPVTVTSGGQRYPDDEHIRACFRQVTEHTLGIDCLALAESLGNARVVNVILLGALSRLIEINQMAVSGVNEETWLRVISERVPKKYLELNQHAFQLGREHVVS
jgi:indolepyruvate ferredoxin oxidoreductase beta subunit